VRQRPVAEVVEEIKASGKRFVLIVDDNIFVNQEKAKELFAALIPLNVRWGCQVSVDIAYDDELLDLMQRSGCIAALVGFESLDEANLKQMKKGWNVKKGHYSEAIRRFRERGIMLYGSFVFGYDHDTLQTFETTAQFAIDAKFAIVNFSVLTPTPGSRLYDRLESEKRMLFDTWWLSEHYRYGQATYQPALMTPDELTNGTSQARKRFFSNSSIFKRFWDFRANSRDLEHVGLYTLMNVISRKELKGKLGKPLGSSSPVTTWRTV
jgi:radical SAM superfamily enzyme YgiQ (UPF0313 family)